MHGLSKEYIMGKVKNWYKIITLKYNLSIALANASILSGLLTAWTPILVIWGAIFLFRTMENTGDMKVIRNWLKELTKNKVAQLMIIGWAFAFLIEGASGFGTPAALAAPLLVGLGFPAVRAAQSAGGAMGNMICINNIVAVCSVLGLQNQEGAILKKTILPMLAYATMVGIVSFIF